MSKRQSVEPPGKEHKSPIPMGCKIGNIVYSSAIGGDDPATGKTSPDPAEQAKTMMENVRRFMTAAGGTPEDIIRLTLYVQDKKIREYFNKEWLAMFPDPHSRPARHALVVDLEKKLFQVEVVAVL
ncbi:MAG TPA: RidA family protein [Alphaproteobacteria bacterium]